MPYFSVIIPAHNTAQYLDRCLQSLQAQSFTDWEAVCVDDGSTDGTGALMDRYAGHLNGSLGAFGWTGGSGTWAESDPSEGVSIVYMHNLMPNMEEYHHLRMRAVAYGCME